MQLRDKVVVVTGSGGSIGEECAKRFTAEGARAVVNDMDPEPVERVVDSIASVGLAADITGEANVQALAAFPLLIGQLIRSGP